MDAHAWIALGTLVAAVTLFISKWIPLEATALSIPVVLAVTGVLPAADCLAGFGNQAVIALGGIFILGAGLKEAGVATMMARGLERMGGRSPTRAILVIMLSVALLSAFMPNVAAVAVFLPAVAVLARRTGIAPSHLMMPLAFAAVLGGTLTLIGTTPNLILGTQLALRTGEGLGMFEFARIGIPVTIVGILYMALVGWRLLPTLDPRAQLGGAAPADLARQYGFSNNLYRMKVPRASPVVGRSIAEVGIRKRYALDVILVLRPAALGQNAQIPDPGFVLEPGDDLYVEGEAEDAWRLAEEETLQLGITDADEIDRLLGRGVGLAEVTLAPRSQAAGKTLAELSFREKHGLNVIAVWRAGEVINTRTADLALNIGDGFLLAGPSRKIRAFAEDPNYVVLGNGTMRAENLGRAPLSILLLMVAILPPLLGWLPLAISALASALLMIFTRCASVDGARRSFDVTILSLLVGTIPLALAIDRTGVAARIADGILQMRDTVGEQGLLGCLFVVSALLSMTSNNGAAAVILAPVAARAAEGADLAVSDAFLAVAYGASCAFVLPFPQCNLMVMSSGGYTTRDFLRVGIPLSILMGITTVLLLG